MPYFSQKMLTLINDPSTMKDLLEEQRVQLMREKYGLMHDLDKKEKRLARIRKGLAQKEAEKQALDITLALVRDPHVLERLSINQSRLEYQVKELHFQLGNMNPHAMVLQYKRLEGLEVELLNITKGLEELEKMMKEVEHVPTAPQPETNP